MTQTTMPRASGPSRCTWPAVALALVALGGCTLQGEPPLALSQPVARPAAVAASPASAPVRTVRATAPRDDDEAVPSVAGVPVAALPTPRQIFDFHPPGSNADTWRQPFVIDANDGPLAADVRRTAAELKAFLAQSRGEAKPGLRTVAARRCGETDVATAKPGCTAAAPAKPPAKAADPAPPTP